MKTSRNGTEKGQNGNGTERRRKGEKINGIGNPKGIKTEDKRNRNDLKRIEKQSER